MDDPATTTAVIDMPTREHVKRARGRRELDRLRAALVCAENLLAMCQDYRIERFPNGEWVVHFKK